MVQRRDFLKTLSIGAASAVLPSLQQAKTLPAPTGDKPNILIVISDQHRAGLTKRSGYPLDTSPSLDSLAGRGVSFDRAYATCPVCVPSRTSLLTGRWPEAHRVRQNSAIKDAFFAKDLFDVAKSMGYRTGLTGKNHSYLRPEKLDFWREYGHLGGWKPAHAPKQVVEFDEWLARLNYGVSDVPSPFPLETQLPYRIVSNALEFLDEYGNSPFALEVSFPEPHDPEQAPKPYWDMYPPGQVPDRCVGPEALKDKGFQWQWLRGLQNDTYPAYDKEWRRYVSNYLGMLRLLDDQLARLMDYMKKKGLLEKTIVVYLADHGDYVMDYGLQRKGAGLPEALVRIPMVWSGWGIRTGSALDEVFVSMADVMPTLCDAVGAEIPPGVQGRSLWPLLQGGDYPKEEFRSIYAGVGFGGLFYDAADHVPFSIAEFQHLGPHPVAGSKKTFDELNPVDQSGYTKMVRMGDWKLLYDMMGYGQLYHLPSDPCELKNLFGDPSVAAEQARLIEELLMWTIRSQDSLPTAAYKTKWPGAHNWYAPYRHGNAPGAFIP
jgi:arylsulfatase A-like enzyme